MTYWDNGQKDRTNVTFHQAERFYKDRQAPFNERLADKLKGPRSQPVAAALPVAKPAKPQAVQPAATRKQKCKSNSEICCLNCRVGEYERKHLNTLDEMSPTNVVKTTINFTNYSFDSLLDTGALQGNYLRADKVEELTKAGVQVKETNVHICAAFGDCVKADCIISLCVVFNDIESDNLLCKNISIRDFNTKPYRVRLDFLVVKELPFEMTVGRRAIITHKLWERCVTTRFLSP
jgi:hypothetical protein